LSALRCSRPSPHRRWNPCAIWCWARSRSSGAGAVYVAVCIAIAAVTFFTAHIPESRYRLLLWLDCARPVFFCVAGADRALVADAGWFIAIVMG